MFIYNYFNKNVHKSANAYIIPVPALFIFLLEKGLKSIDIQCDV